MLLSDLLDLLSVFANHKRQTIDYFAMSQIYKYLQAAVVQSNTTGALMRPHVVTITCVSPDFKRVSSSNILYLNLKISSSISDIIYSTSAHVNIISACVYKLCRFCIRNGLLKHWMWTSRYLCFVYLRYHTLLYRSPTTTGSLVLVIIDVGVQRNL